MDSRRSLAAVTFDFDTLARDLFRPPIDDATIRSLEDLSFSRLLPRILEWLDGLNVRATFFMIGQHVGRYRGSLTAIADRGHEIANHTFGHPREFSRLSRQAIHDEIRRGGDALGDAIGRPMSGFRAPGYTVNWQVLEALAALGYAYDASLVPSWLYSSVKSLYRAIGGRDYRAYLHPQEVRCALAPKSPYFVEGHQLFVSSPTGRLLEIPITTVGPMQFPLIFGLLSRMGARVQRSLERLAVRQAVVSISFHDLEFAGIGDFGSLPVGRLTRPHVSRPLATRLEELSTMIRRFQPTHRFVPLREVAAAYGQRSAEVNYGAAGRSSNSAYNETMSATRRSRL